MAISAVTFSPKEFEVGIQSQTAFGTGLVNGMTKIDVDSISFPSLAPTQVMEQRTGSRFVDKLDFFQTNKNTVTEIQLSGTLKESYCDMLLTSLLQGSAGYALSSGVFTISNNYSPISLGVSGASDEFDVSGTSNVLLTVGIKSPEADGSIVLPDCVCTAFNITGDMGTEGGRVKFTATLKTGAVIGTSDLNVTSSGITMGAMVETDILMSDADNTRTLHGVADVIPTSFALNIENDAYFVGYTKAGGHQVIGRAPEMNITCDMSAKYDNLTEPLIATFQTQTGSGSVAVTQLSEDSTVSASNFGFKISSGVLTSVAYNEGDTMMLDASVKALGSSGTAEVFSIGF